MERGTVARFDLSSVEEADGAAVALLLRSQAELLSRRVVVELFGATAPIAELLAVYSGGAARTAAGRPEKTNAKERLSGIGQRCVRRRREVQGWLGVLRRNVRGGGGLVRRPRAQNWTAILPLMERAGAGPPRWCSSSTSSSGRGRV